MGAERAGGVAKASLPERGQIEQAFDQNHSRERADGVPGKQTTLRSGQKAMRERHADATAIQIDDASILVAGENDTPAETVQTAMVDESGLRQPIEGMAQSGEMTVQVSTRSIPDRQFLDEVGITQTTPLEIVHGFRMAVELKLIKSGCPLQQLRTGSRC